MWVYDEDADLWKTLNTPEKIGLEAKIVVEAQGNLPVHGGLQGHEKHIKYNVGEITLKGVKLRIADGLTLGPDGSHGHLYACGGTDSRNTGQTTDQLFIYDESTDEWREGKPMSKKLVQ